MLYDDKGGQDPAEGPWNPGIGSALPRELLALSTIFRTENVFYGVRQAMELRDLAGLALEELAIFRPERLALHEVLVRVTADFEVPDPESASVSSLGTTFRRMVQAVLSRGIQPGRSEIAHEYDGLKRELAGFIKEELSAAFANTGPSTDPGCGRDTSPGSWKWLRTATGHQRPPLWEGDWERDERVLQEWTARANSSGTPLHAIAFRSLVKVASRP